MKVIDIINNNDGKGTKFAFELLPPLKGENIDKINRAIDPLMRFDPSYINVTYHREDIKYVNRADGLLEKRIVKRRPGTVSISAAIKYKYDIEVVPHIICGGHSSYDIEDMLIELNFLGIHNLLVLRGDALKGERFSPHPQGFAHANELVERIAQMNKGKYLDSEIENSYPTQFCVGVAGYPEKHSESPNMKSDIEALKAKVDAGADYIVTQMFFDNSKYFQFVDQCRAAGINVPIIPGLKPFSTKSQLNIIPQTFHVDLPDDLVAAVEKCRDNAAVREVGVEWAIAQSKELKAAGVPVLHYYTMGNADNVEKIVEAVF